MEKNFATELQQDPGEVFSGKYALSQASDKKPLGKNVVDHSLVKHSPSN